MEVDSGPTHDSVHRTFQQVFCMLFGWVDQRINHCKKNQPHKVWTGLGSTAAESASVLSMQP